MTKRIISLLLAICMIASLAIVASAADGADSGKKICLRLRATPKTDATTGEITQEIGAFLDVIEGGKIVYALTTPEGYTTTKGADQGNYHIKIEFPAGGTPTIYLKGAKIVNDANGGYGLTAFAGNRGGVSTDIPYNLNVVVEADSSILANSIGLQFAQGDLIISSVNNAKLSIESQVGSPISVSTTEKECNVTVKNANLELKSASKYNIYNPGKGNVVIENSTVSMTNDGLFNGQGVTYGEGIHTNKGGVTISGSTITANTYGTAVHSVGSVAITGSTLNVTTSDRALYSDDAVSLKDSTFTASTDHKEHALVDAFNDFTIENSTVELTGTKAAVLTACPTFQGDYTAVGGEEAAEEYFVNANVSAYQYVKIVPGANVDMGVTVQPDNGNDDTTEDTGNDTTEDNSNDTTENKGNNTNEDKDNNANNDKTPAGDKDNKPSENKGNSVSVNPMVLTIIVIAVVGIGAAVAIVIIRIKKAA